MLLQIVIAAIGTLLLVVITAIAAFLFGRHMGKQEALRNAALPNALPSPPAPAPAVAAPAAPAPVSPPVPPPAQAAQVAARIAPTPPVSAPTPPPTPSPKPRLAVKWAPPPPSESSEPKEIDLSHADPYLNWLFAEGGKIDGKSYHIGRRTVTIGRGEGNFIQVAVPEFSRVHCRITPVDEGLEIKDAGSANGIYYEGKKNESFLLRNGQSFKIGTVKFLYHQIANFDTDHVAEKKKAGPWVRMATVLSQQPIPRPVYLDEDDANPAPAGWQKHSIDAPPLIHDDGNLLEALEDEDVEEPTWGGISDESPESTTNVDAGGGLKSKTADELRGYLWDETWRLHAAIQLIRRGEAAAVPDVFRAAEGMQAQEQSALLQGMPPRTDEIETALLSFLDVGTPTSIYLAACTLAGMASERAIPRLFELIEDPIRVPTPRFFAQAFIPYGESLKDDLSSRLRAAGKLQAEHPLIFVTEALTAAVGPHFWQEIAAAVPEVSEFAPAV